MRAIVVDDERMAREGLAIELSKISDVSDVAIFSSAEDALAYAGESPVDVAFLDIEMYGMNGILLAQKLKEMKPRTNIVFVTGYSSYALDAFDIAASDYLLKPASNTSIQRALERLRYPVDAKASSRLYIQCFGNFEALVMGKPIKFARAKTKEMLAYLVSKQGALCTNKEIVSVLWEDTANSNSLQNYFRQLVLDLIGALHAVGAEDILIRNRGSLAIAPDKFYCDLYQFIKGDAAAINNYRGEFMAQYSWAEFINGYLELGKHASS